MREDRMEPPLEEMLDDPIVRLVLARDRLTPDAVRAAMRDAALRLRSRRQAGDGGLCDGVQADGVDCRDLAA